MCTSAYHGFTLALNKNSEAEVDALFAELRGKNVTILKEPHRVFWGGYQRLPDDSRESNDWHRHAPLADKPRAQYKKIGLA